MASLTVPGPAAQGIIDGLAPVERPHNVVVIVEGLNTAWIR